MHEALKRFTAINDKCRSAEPNDELKAALKQLADECERQEILFAEEMIVETKTGRYQISVNRFMEN